MRQYKKTKKYRLRMYINEIRTHIGYFNTLNECIEIIKINNKNEKHTNI